MKYHFLLITTCIVIKSISVLAFSENIEGGIKGEITYSSYFGGSASDIIFGMASDGKGNIYIAGNTSSLDFPIKSATQSNYGGGKTDAFVAKFSSEGENLYTTYLGGSDWEYGFDVIADNEGNAYITGKTLSDDFPIKNAFQSIHKGNWDGYIVKLNPKGEIVFSTYLGGTDKESGYCIKVDAQGYIYITGKTWSQDFPIKNALQNKMGGGTSSVDAFITKLSPNGELIFSTFFGGSDWDYSYTIALDKHNNILFGGRTNSMDFPVKNSIQVEYGGGKDDAYIAKLSNDGQELIFSSFFGGNEFDRVMDIALDNQDNIYVFGHTESDNFPIKNPFQDKFRGGRNDAFVMKISPECDKVLFSSYIGGAGYDYSSNITVDNQDNCYIIGRTTSSDFPIKNSIQPVYGGDIDVFFAQISDKGELLFSTFLGGSAKDEGRALTLVSHNIYITGSTASFDFKTKNPFQPVFNGGGWDAFIVKFNLK